MLAGCSAVAPVDEVRDFRGDPWTVQSAGPATAMPAQAAAAAWQHFAFRGKSPARFNYERDIRADYERAFGEPPGALVGIAIMSDSDNTRSTAQAWYAPVRLDGDPLARN